MSLNCPHCGQELTPEELAALWGAYRAARRGPAKPPTPAQIEARRANLAKARESRWRKSSQPS